MSTSGDHDNLERLLVARIDEHTAAGKDGPILSSAIRPVRQDD